MSMTSRTSRGWIFLVVLVVAFAAAALWKFAKPSAPSRIVMATGPAGGAYAVFGKRYAEILKRDGVTLELRESKGSIENIALLQDTNNDIEVALLQSGVASEKQREDLISLGSLFYEPLWVFYRMPVTTNAKDNIAALDRITQLRGKRLGVGAQGSGTRPVVQALLEANDINASSATLIEAAPRDAAAMLQRGELDAIFLVAAADSPLVIELLSAPGGAQGIRLMNMATADAYSRLVPSLVKITIPRGVIGLNKDIPAQPVDTVAATATLIAMEKLHPAIAYLFVKAAKEVHGGGGILHAQREFPSVSKYQEFEVPEQVDQLYKNGTPFLYRHLPFGMANLAMRLWVLLIPLGAILISASDFLPKLMGAKMNMRVSALYQDARKLEFEIIAAAHKNNHIGAEMNQRFRERLSLLDARADQLKGPSSTAKTWYELRSHLQLVHDRLDGLQSSASSST
jgi:TRAP transporter TAXI family solute receptor